MSPGTQAKFKVVAQDDNSNGNLQPRLRYNIPATGCYTLVIFPWQQSDDAPMTTAVLRKETWGQYRLVCRPFCQYVRDHSVTSFSVPITGVFIHPPAFDIMTTKNPRNGADPWVFVFNYTSHTGASNDDTPSDDSSLNSTIDIPGFSYDGSPYSGVLLTGYYTPAIPQDASFADAPIVEWWAYKRAQ